MKCTLNLDVDLIEKVKKITRASTRTEAIHIALREVDRRDRLTRALKEGAGVKGKALTHLFDEASDPAVLRVAESPASYPKAKK